MSTHTMNDLRLSKEHLTATAWGFVERSAMVFLGGLAPSEMGNLEEVFALSSKEKALMTDWTGEAVVDQRGGGIDIRSRGQAGSLRRVDSEAYHGTRDDISPA